MITKEERFNVGIQKWIANDCKGIFDYATGVGKTTVGIKCAEHILRKVNSKFSITIVVPNDIIKTQWISRIKELLPKKFHINFNFYTINEIIQSDIIIETHVLGLDEVHEFTSEKALEVLKNNIHFTYYFALTASTDDKNFYKLKGLEIIDTITEADAVELGFISPFIEYNLGLEFTPQEKLLYDRQTEIIEYHKTTFTLQNYHYIMLCNLVINGGNNNKGVYYTGEQWAKGIAIKNGYDVNNVQSEASVKFSPKVISNKAFVILKATRKRLDILKEASAKQTATIAILEMFPETKAIVFSESTAIADKLYARAMNINIPCTIFHSNLKSRKLPGKQGKLITYGKTRLKNLALDKLASGEAKVIFTGSTLDKGFNQEDVKLSITISGTRNKTKYKQRAGRSKRVFGTQQALLINLYITDTVDADSIRDRQYSVNHKIFEITSVDEIEFNKVSDFNVNNL